MTIAQDALIAAARLFEPERGVPFRVFAWPRVRGVLSRSVAVAGRHGWLERKLHGSTPARIQVALDRGDLQHELRELLTAAAEAYRQLPQDHATLIRAHYLEGKSLKAIADEMGLGGKRVYGLHLISDNYFCRCDDNYFCR